MATLVEVFDNAVTNSDLRNRTAAAIAQTAWNVFAEQTPVAERIEWAKQAIGNVMGMADTWVWAVAGNATVQAANFIPTDGDLLYIVGVLVDDYAAPAA